MAAFLAYEKLFCAAISSPKFYEQNCLLEQGYVKEDNMKVSAYIQASEKEFGGAITVAKVVRFEKGEGIQKRDDNFADEIAQLVNGK